MDCYFRDVWWFCGRCELNVCVHVASPVFVVTSADVGFSSSLACDCSVCGCGNGHSLAFVRSRTVASHATGSNGRLV